MASDLDALIQAIVHGDSPAAVAATQKCLNQGIPAQQLFDKAIIAGIQETGQLWDANRYFVPDVILSADAFRAATGVIEDHLGRDAVRDAGRIVIGVVEGDVHDLGKGIVVALLQGAGFEVIDIGVDNPVDNFIQAVRDEKPDILGIGAYMSTTMLLAQDIIAALYEAGLRDRVQVMIGGVPTSQHFAEQIGADAWARDASGALEQARKLIAGTGGGIEQ